MPDALAIPDPFALALAKSDALAEAEAEAEALGDFSSSFSIPKPKEESMPHEYNQFPLCSRAEVTSIRTASTKTFTSSTNSQTTIT